MENPVRTAEHLARIKQRRSDLQDKITAMLPRGAIFVCEIGCGHGHFLTAYASAHPTRLCVGVDISGERIGRALRKRDRAKLANLYFIQADAGDFLDALPPKITLSDLYILFPDPWPKRRHHKNRLLQPEFLHVVAQRAGRGARLYFRTDYEPYFRDTESLITRHPNWEIVAEPWPFEHVTVFQSRAAQHSSLIARPRARDHKLGVAGECTG
jgi:tRNA (guanine-N7-)-methyltransferase